MSVLLAVGMDVFFLSHSKRKRSRFFAQKKRHEKREMRRCRAGI
jgi:hypothetical protein